MAQVLRTHRQWLAVGYGPSLYRRKRIKGKSTKGNPGANTPSACLRKVVNLSRVRGLACARCRPVARCQRRKRVCDEASHRVRFKEGDGEAGAGARRQRPFREMEVETQSLHTRHRRLCAAQ